MCRRATSISLFLPSYYISILLWKCTRQRDNPFDQLPDRSQAKYHSFTRLNSEMARMRERGRNDEHMRIVESLVKDSSRSPTTYVLAESHGKLYIAAKHGTLRRHLPFKALDVSKWYDKPGYMSPIQLHPDALYPRAKDSYHDFRWRKGEDHSEVYKKFQHPLEVARDQGRPGQLNDGMVKMLTEREIGNCELLRNDKYPNIAEYRGVICKDYIKFGKETSHSFRMELDTKRVYKIVFKKYDCDLWNMVRSGKRFDVKYCLKSIEAGILHMHNLGLCHNDIKPTNVFVETLCSKHTSRQHEFVVGDFDSTAPTGSKFELKGGTKYWCRTMRQGDRIEEDNDWFAFQNLLIWLVEETGGRLEDYSGIGKKIAGANGPRSWR
jgi:hypothetical protein